MLDVLLGLQLHRLPDAECTHNLVSPDRILMAGLTLFLLHSDSFHFSFLFNTILCDVARFCVIDGLVFISCRYS